MGKTVVISSHLLSEIELIANRMVIIDRGKKIVEGQVKELLDPAKTIVYVETRNNHLAMQTLSKSPWRQVTLESDHLQIMMDKSDVPQLIQYFAANNIDILSVSPRHSLEDYFLKLTKKS